MEKQNIPNEKIEPLLRAVSGKLGVPPEELRAQLEAGKFDAALKNMSPRDAEKFQHAMRNPKMVEKLMSSSQAKALYQKLTGGK